jgi:hypothetical protein
MLPNCRRGAYPVVDQVDEWWVGCLSPSKGLGGKGLAKPPPFGELRLRRRVGKGARADGDQSMQA